jgi:hypothetical protein
VKSKWEENIFEPDTEIDLSVSYGLFVHLYLKEDDIYFLIGNPMEGEYAEDYLDQTSGYVGTYLVIGHEIKKILNKGLSVCLEQKMLPEDSCDYMMSELEGFELDDEGGKTLLEVT